MAERTITTESILNVTLDGFACNMDQAGISTQTVTLGQMADVMKPLQMTNGLDMTGPKGLAKMLETGATISRGRDDRYDVRLVPGGKKAKFPLVEIERRDESLEPFGEPLVSNVKQALRVIEQCNQIPFYRTPYGAKFGMAVTLGLNGYVELIQFTCPKVNPGEMFGPNPELYIDIDAANSSFETGGRDQRLDKIITDLRQNGINSRLRLVIGDQDEEDIFPVIGRPDKLDPEVAEQRRGLYRDSLERRIQLLYPNWTTESGDCLFTVERISEIEKLTKPIPGPVSLEDPVTQADMAIEAAQMRALFDKGNYYGGLPIPSLEGLRQIVELKFQAYARQGYSLQQRYPYAVFLQNEIPLQLRTRMINRGNRQYNKPGQELNAAYPYAER